VSLELPAAYSLQPGGFDVFRNFVYRIPLQETRWIRALEFRPGDTSAVHHATIAVDRSPGSRLQDERDPVPGFDGMINTNAQRPDGHLLGWVPGKMPYVVDPEIAWRLDPGDDLVVQLHLQPTGRTEAVHPTLGLFFADEPATRTPFLLRLGSLTLDIAAGDASYTIEDHYVLPVDVTLLGIVPHAHYVGRRMSFWATRPDGTRLRLLEIPDWDFNWQDEYRYAEPVPLPKGTALSMRFVYDNSADNPRNPSIPPVPVRFGPNTTDEMGDMWIQVLPDDETLLPVLAADFTLKDVRAQVAGYRQYLGNVPDDVTSRVDLGRALQSLGRLDEALAEYRTAVETDPEHAVARHRLAEALRLTGSYGQAATEYTRVLDALPDLAEIHFNLGQTLLALGRREQAAARFARAIDLQPELAEPYGALAGLAAAGGDQAGAERLYRQALERDPSYAPAYNNLGSLLAQSGRLDEAAEYFRAAIEADPAYAAAHDNLGKVAASRGAWNDAVALFTAAVRLDPGYEPARRNLERARRMASR
jgi:tetratricopeptide (TPR) repeat protein